MAHSAAPTGGPLSGTQQLPFQVTVTFHRPRHRVGRSSQQGVGRDAGGCAGGRQMRGDVRPRRGGAAGGPRPHDRFCVCQEQGGATSEHMLNQERECEQPGGDAALLEVWNRSTDSVYVAKRGGADVFGNVSSNISKTKPCLVSRRCWRFCNHLKKVPTTSSARR